MVAGQQALVAATARPRATLLRASLVLLAVLLAVVLPLTLDIFRLNLVGKYLTYAFVAIGLFIVFAGVGLIASVIAASFLDSVGKDVRAWKRTR